jgi:hypothetical protein
MSDLLKLDALDKLLKVPNGCEVCNFFHDVVMNEGSVDSVSVADVASTFRLIGLF